jgi:glycosyltransferase involved in cell wall biosynthesis
MEAAEKRGKVDMTVFVTCYNEQDLIVSALETVRTTMALFPHTYEVLIYDDKSKDNSVQVVTDYIQKNGLQGQFELVANPVNQGIGINYFRGAEKGRGDYYLIVHGDEGPDQARHEAAGPGGHHRPVLRHAAVQPEVQLRPP